MSLLAEKNALQFAVPGGLIGVGTKIDPKLTRLMAGREGLLRSGCIGWHALVAEEWQTEPKEP